MTSPDFAAAQSRIAERRRLRDHKRQSQQHLRQQAVDATGLGRLPAPLRRYFTTAWTQWDRITSREGTRPAFRVGQVDAELLDEELLNLLKAQVEEALKYYGPNLRNDWHAEIQLVLRTVLFKLTIWDHDASYGASLQNLKYSDARGLGVGRNPGAAQAWQKALYGLVSVGGRYGWGKWNEYLLDLEGGYDEPSARVKLLSRLTSLATTTHSVAAFASFLIFLVNGQYRTLLDRILRLRLTPTTSQVSREVSFEYLNRQLVWHAFTEFLLFLLPLVGISRWRRWIARAWRKTVKTFRSDASADDEDDRTGGELGFLPERTCAICYQDQNPTSSSEQEIAAISAASSGVIGSAATDVTNPYETIPCGCVYCFVCLAQRLEGEDGEGWVCLRCGELVKECKPWSGDILVDDADERKSSSSSSNKSLKKVTFVDEQENASVDESFQTLDPMPLEEEERSAKLSADISSGFAGKTGSSLGESTAWSELEEEEDPDADERTIRGAHEYGDYDPASALLTGDHDEEGGSPGHVNR